MTGCPNTSSAARTAAVESAPEMIIDGTRQTWTAQAAENPSTMGSMPELRRLSCTTPQIRNSKIRQPKVGLPTTRSAGQVEFGDFSTRARLAGTNIFQKLPEGLCDRSRIEFTNLVTKYNSFTTDGLCP